MRPCSLHSLSMFYSQVWVWVWVWVPIILILLSWSMCVIEFHLANRRPSDIDFIQSNACWQEKQQRHRDSRISKKGNRKSGLAKDIGDVGDVLDSDLICWSASRSQKGLNALKNYVSRDGERPKNYADCCAQLLLCRITYTENRTNAFRKFS